MDINIKNTKRKYDFSFSFNRDDLKLDDEIVGELDGIMQINGSVEKLTDEKVFIKFTVDGHIIYPCSRCLTPVLEEISYPFEEEIEIESNGVITLDGYINDCLFINEPSQVLCKEECKGLCPICGQNLNEGSCNCSDEQEDEIDPRLAKLKELL